MPKRNFTTKTELKRKERTAAKLSVELWSATVSKGSQYIPSRNAYDNYLSFCELNNLVKSGHSAWGRYMKQRGFSIKRGRSGNLINIEMEMSHEK